MIYKGLVKVRITTFYSQEVHKMLVTCEFLFAALPRISNDS